MTPATASHRAPPPLEFPLWDLQGQRTGLPVYQLLAESAGKTVTEPQRVRCYDTSLYIDDLHLATDEEGAALIASEARFGYEHGHRSFKIKVGRGARHMPLLEGNRRDVAVIRAVRAEVGPDAAILIDANNGYNLNISKHILAETADCNLFWLEEAFHEDGALYEDLHEWIEREGLSTNIADGEGQASPMLLDYARDGFVDIIQYDIFSYGITNWLETGARLDGWNVSTAPHHYGATSATMSPAIWPQPSKAFSSSSGTRSPRLGWTGRPTRWRMAMFSCRTHPASA